MSCFKLKGKHQPGFYPLAGCMLEKDGNELGQDQAAALLKAGIVTEVKAKATPPKK